jgi:nicotinate-nucleotide adenylyltransferase
VNALRELALDRVLLVPARLSPHKGEGSDPGAEHRLAMCLLAIEGLDGLEVSTLELGRDGPSYTVDTLSAIHERSPDVQLTFILGADIAGTLPAWREPARLLELADLAVAARNGSDRGRALEAVAALNGSAERVSFLQMPPVEVSSSDIRARVRAGEPIEGLVGAPVARYIGEHRLYTARSRDGD